MAHIKHVWVMDTDAANKTMQVAVALRPSGEVTLKVPLPPQFYDAIRSIAQTAADAHEAQMQAEILGERHDAA